MAKYKIEVTTGNLPNAGTDADVKIKIGGNEVSTDDAPLVMLDNFLIDDFERNQTDKFEIQYDFDVGEIECIGIQLGPLHTRFDDAWYVDTIKIGKTVESDENGNGSDESKKDDEFLVPGEDKIG